MVKAICKELELQKKYLLDEPISSIYFGGGTPSLLSSVSLTMLLETIRAHYNIQSTAEITLEANPDDLDGKVLKQLHENGINRLSIGIQSFNEEQLKFLNRAHNARQAKACVIQAQEVGFKNISIDLIYGIPSKDHSIWSDDLATVIALSPQHISSYCLTIEPETVFGRWTSKGKMPPIEEEYAATQFEMLMELLARNGYEQYEISNFCMPGYYSKHNSSYWKQEKYLGVGPGAHSYNFKSRQYNISNNAKYLEALHRDEIPYTLDVLDETAWINEYLMTSLRTKWGCELNWLKEKFDFDLRTQHDSYIQSLLDQELATLKENTLILTHRGKLLADKITEDLFIINEKRDNN